jgi:hypothetical protein
MKYRAPFLCAAILLIAAPTSLTAEDALWQSAIRLASPENAERARSMTMNAFEKNLDGEIVITTRLFYRWDNQEQDFVLVSAVENGKDVTDRERRRSDRGNGEGRGEYAHQVFNPEKADGLKLTPREDSAVVAGRECRVYDFRFEDEWPMGPGKPKPVTEEGSVYLDSKTGLPLLLESRLVDGPSAVRSFTYRMDARAGTGGAMRLDVLEMEFEGRMVVHFAGGFSMVFEY